MGKEVVQINIGSRGRGNRFEPGITAAERYGTNPIEDTGVPLQGFKGEAKDQGRGQFGVPIPGQGPVSVVKPVCHAENKKGDPCGAHPVKGEEYCVGHMRQHG